MFRDNNTPNYKMTLQVFKGFFKINLITEKIRINE